MAEIFDRQAGQFVCDFVSRLPTTDTGKPFNLYDWQRSALMEFYGTMEEDAGELLRKYWYLYLEIPKKNGKSELAAALGLYHLFGDGELNAEVYICAADRENAGIVFRAAVFMLETAPWTAKMIARGELKVSKSQKRIEYRRRVRGRNGGYAWVTMEQLRGKTCYGGVDLATSWDMTAFVLLFPPQPGLDAAVLVPHIWRPKDTVEEAEKRDHVPYRDWERAGFLRLCEGNIIDYDDIEQTIREAAERYDLKMVGFDPYLSRTITQRLSKHVTTIEVPQDLKNMSPAMKEMDTMMEKRDLLHVHNTCFRWTFGNVRCYVDGNGNIKPLKNRSVGRIDPTVASIIVVAVWMIARNQPPDLAEAMKTRDYHL